MKEVLKIKQILENQWWDLISDEFQKDYYLKLREKLIEEYSNYTIYPDKYDIFNALKWTDYKDVKAVILGQDPYHGPNQAHGLSFSVKMGVAIPKSLNNIYKELHSDINCPIPKHGYLKSWADEGVLLLNTALTVRAGDANSHKGFGWENFTNRIIEELNKRDDSIVFILWGANAKAKASIITNPKHLIISSPHPSPFSAHTGFFGSKPFSRTNDFLIKEGKSPIDWNLTK